MWHLVYHGIVLYNAEATTLNFPIHKEKHHLQVLEHGARPTLYFNQDETGDWRSHNDFRCGTEEEAAHYTKIVADVEAEYREIARLQYEFMVKHENLPDNKVRVTYSDGSVMTIDYENETWHLEKGKAYAE